MVLDLKTAAVDKRVDSRVWQPGIPASQFFYHFSLISNKFKQASQTTLFFLWIARKVLLSGWEWAQMCTPCSFAGSSFSMLFELDAFPKGPTHAFSHVLGLMESASHALALGFRVSQNSGAQKLNAWKRIV